MSEIVLSVVVLFSVALGVLALAFWIWMLIDCVTNEPSEGNDKLIWVLIIVLLSWLGAILYWFVRRPQRLRRFGK